jgi:hypothetical protein
VHRSNWLKYWHYDGIDFRICRNYKILKMSYGVISDDVAYENKYFGISFHPYEVIIFKSKIVFDHKVMI